MTNEFQRKTFIALHSTCCNIITMKIKRWTNNFFWYMNKNRYEQQRISLLERFRVFWALRNEKTWDEKFQEWRSMKP
jgi:hypothetical protein